MKLLNVPFAIITFSSLVGVLLGYYLNVDIITLLLCFFASICLLGISWKQSKKIFAKTFHFTLLMIVVFILFGTVLVKIHHPRNHSNHYTNLINLNHLPQNKIGIQFHIKERLKPTSYYCKYIASIKFINNKTASGNLLLLLPKESISKTLDFGNTYTTYAELKPIPKPLNPYQFDYAKHLSRQYIFHQITTQEHLLINNNIIEWSLFRLADQIRKHINQKLETYNFSSKQLSIINALFLGQRQDIDQETFNAYRDAGAIHILAVSGLHVGIILLILNFIFRPLDLFYNHGKTIKLILTITSLWSFAIVAGLSPSVLRAVTMFSFLAIGMQIRSKTSIYNSLFISMFILLCFNPLLLFSVGFQLSYLAVFAIVWIQPIVAQRYHPKYYVIKKLWETFTVTIAAQLGLLPLTLFYFHQFPGLFFVSNLIIIPFLGVLLGYGIAIILLACFGILPQFMAVLFGLCIDFMNNCISWVAKQEEFLFTGIPFSKMMLIMLFIVIILVMMMLQKQERRRLYLSGISMLTMVSILIYEKHTASKIQELVIFQNQRNTTLGVLENLELHIYSKDSISSKTQKFLFENYQIQNHTTLVINNRLKNVYKYKEKTILIIDSSSIYNITALKPDILLLSNSPKIHLDRVINSLHPKQIIVDGSNYKSFIDQWEKSCYKRKIPFYRTDKKGAFILK